MSRSNQSNAQSGNGASTDDIVSSTTISSPPRARLEELEAAVSPTTPGVHIGQLEARYECRGKIKRGEYFRTHPDRGLWQDTAALVDEDGLEKTTYLVNPAVQPLLQRWLSRTLLIPCINQDRNLFIWSIKISDMTLGQRPSRSEALRRRAAEQAQDTWLTVVWHQNDHQIVTAEAPAQLGEPHWPDDLNMSTILMRTFSDRLIADAAHPLVRVYLGQARR
jgi:hypothetical protein